MELATRFVHGGHNMSIKTRNKIPQGKMTASSPESRSTSIRTGIVTDCYFFFYCVIESKTNVTL